MFVVLAGQGSRYSNSDAIPCLKFFSAHFQECPSRCGKPMMGPAIGLEHFIKSSSVNSTSKRKISSDDDEVKILDESIFTWKEPEAGTSSSTSSNFKSSCPLCDRVFECFPELEAHANACDGQSAGQSRDVNRWNKYII